MKNKSFVILAIIAVTGIVVAFNYGLVLAQQQEAPAEPFDSTKGELIPVEFSTVQDVDQAGVLDAQQNLFTRVPDEAVAPPPQNTFDFSDTDPINVDALANGGDHLFHELTKNTANLLISVEGDTKGKALWCVWMEDVAGGKSPKWKKTDLDMGGVALPESRDLDALEVWGPRDSDDANFYSLVGDPVVGGLRRSVFYWNGAVSTPYIDQAVIVAAVQSAALDTPDTPTLAEHYTGPADSVDLDGLMVFEHNGVNGDHIWNTGDSIIFSIRKAHNWDGGEIVVLPFGGTPSYLKHGGHPWNTGFDVTLFGVDTDEVDAIEAFPTGQYATPTLTQWGLIILVLLLIASAVFVALKRRKATEPA